MEESPQGHVKVLCWSVLDFGCVCFGGTLWKEVLGSLKPLAQTSLPQFKIRPLLG